MSLKPKSLSAETERFDGRLFLTDDNLDRGALSVLAAARRLDLGVMHYAKSAGFSHLQMTILLFLHHQPGESVKALREALGGTVPTIARILGELDSEGLIHRPKAETDGRNRALMLSERGKAHVEACLKLMRTDMKLVYRQTGEPSVTGALQLLSALSLLPIGDAR